MFSVLMNGMKKAGMLPNISATEQQALEAGTVWAEGEFFSGAPNFKKMLGEAYPQLTEEEQAYLDGPIEELCRMTDNWDIKMRRSISPELLDFMRKNRVFGMAIPKQYGGLGFSGVAKSAVKAKVAAANGALYNWVSIPSSLGPAELISRYGTNEQKDHYLSRLAKGEYYPCFGLTEPAAGSDATSLQAEALVVKNSDGELKLQLNFRKRYITMAPVANLVSLACQLNDPDQLLGKGTHPGISIVMVHKGTPGLEIGDWHHPMGIHLPNGPIVGKNVMVPVTNVVGGIDGVGQGWRMLVECLAAGRCISLPAVAIGPLRTVADQTGAYSMVRQQFGIEIGHMEGVRARVARLAAFSYMFEGARIYTCAAVDAGHKPAVISALLKYASTEVARQGAIDAMDVFGGKGIQQGPNNYLADTYSNVPVAITVEGANILTRTLIIFGQGAVRGHPYAYRLTKALENHNVPEFRSALLGWLGHFAAAGVRTVVHSITRGRLVAAPVKGETANYYRKLAWSSARFAWLTNVMLFALGPTLKSRGKLSGRMADVLSWQYLALCTLRRFEAEGRRKEDLPLVHWSLQHALSEVQQAYEGIYANFGSGLLGWSMRLGLLLLRLNALASKPSDKLDIACAAAVQTPGDQRDRVLAGAFRDQRIDAGAGQVEHAFQLISATKGVVNKIRNAARKKTIARADLLSMGQAAMDAGLISDVELAQLQEAEKARLSAYEVDSFSAKEYYAQANLPPHVKVENHG